MRYHPHAGHAPPSRHHYRSYYTRWYCHPYYRYRYSTTMIVHFGYETNPWS
ncbi:MAG: hypothetical protein ACI9MC_004088, partial [Kiritimatiellia bacterium]